ncbi:MobQ family relaxase [Pectobacterium polaris]|uniref:MobQ family relaxase n=1 Tax=Pectobacterium polaris TaxID=2042057 RepID=UPI001F349B8D|nr:MobQ family relaxase [Pectobacterium polaris]
MAIFHLSFKVLTRITKEGKSKSSVYLAAYNSRLKLTDEKTGKIFNYTQKQGLYKSGILLPEQAPDRFYNRSYLWNQVEKIERRKNSQLCRNFIIALPKGIAPARNEELLKCYLNKCFIAKGMIADYAIHDIESGNPHAHVMLTMRKVNKDGFLNKKCREWNDPKLVEEWRRSWAVLVNKVLRENNVADTITNLSHLRQKKLFIHKAKEEIKKGHLKKAEDFIHGVNILNKKPPRKRISRNEYIDLSNNAIKNNGIRARLRQQLKINEENQRKNKWLGLFFSKFMLKIKGGFDKNNAKLTEVDFYRNMKIENDETKENLELKQYIDEEIKKGDYYEFNKENHIPYAVKRPGIRNK